MSDKTGIVITHDGDPHFDDFFSTALVIYRCSIIKDFDEIKTIYRRSPTDEEINNSRIWKLDIGRGFNPKLKLYDHHPAASNNGFLSKQQQELLNECTFSLLLKDWGLWQKSIEVFKWLPFAVMMDANGPRFLIQELSIDSKVLDALESFIEHSVLYFFQQKKVIRNTDTIFSLLHFVGKTFFEEIDEYYTVLSQVEENIQFMLIKEVPIIKCFRGVKPTNSLNIILNKIKRAKWGDGGIVIYPNNRPFGSIAIKRYDNDERVDFRRINGRNNVIFTHANGFLAVVNNEISNDELNQYINDSIK